MSAGIETNHFKLPRWYIMAVLGLSILPGLLIVFDSLGFHWPESLFHWFYSAPGSSLNDFLFILIVWTSFCASLTVGVLGTLHFVASANRIPLMIAGCFLMMGLFNLEQGLLVTRGFLGMEGSYRDQLELNLAAGRISTVLLAPIGVLVLVLRKKGLEFGAFVARLVFLMATGLLLYWLLTYGPLVSVFKNLLLPIGPLAGWAHIIPFLVSIGPILYLTWKLFRLDNSIFNETILVTMFPVVLMELHASLGSFHSFDKHYYASLFMKVLVYLSPLGGLCIDYFRMQRGTEILGQLQVAQANLLEKKKDLEKANRQLAQQIEKRLEFEQALKSSETIKSSVLNGSIDGILTFDETGKIISYNPAADEMFGLTQKSRSRRDLELSLCHIIPKRYVNRYHGRLNSRHLATIPRRRRVQIMGLAAGGGEFPLEVSLTPIRHGRQNLYTAYIRDITERLRWRQEIVSAREEAIRASTAKTEFLANMSHEIRTPLNAIIGMTDLLAETPLEADQDRYLRISRRASRTLLNIVNDVLDLSKIEAGQLELEEIDFDLHSLVENISEMMAVRAYEKNLNLSLHIRSDVPRVLRGDLNRIRQILLNLIGNAIKFTRNGEVSIRVERTSLDGGRDRVVFIVRDTGIGIHESKLSSIFEKFTQADSSVTRHHGGTGLGLAISKRLTDAMGGSIQVKSRIGEGSVFTIELPLKEPARTPAMGLKDYFFNLEGRRVLVVCESITTRGLLTDWMSSWGGATVEALNGAQAADVFKAPESEGGFDLVFVNDKLSDISGLDLIRKFHACEKNARTRFILMSGDSRTESRECLTESGVAAVIMRPVKRSDLMEVMAKCLGRVVPRSMNWQTEELVFETEKNPQAAVRGKVLLVEDSRDNQALVQAYLRGTHILLDIATNGAEACEKFHLEAYDLVLMDMQMPVMDGYSATRAIRGFEAESGRPKTPILALTAHALTEEIKKSLDAGCDGHLAKPVRKQQLLETIQIFTKEVSDAGGAIEKRGTDDLGRPSRPRSRGFDSIVHAESAE